MNESGFRSVLEFCSIRFDLRRLSKMMSFLLLLLKIHRSVALKVLKEATSLFGKLYGGGNL